MAPVAEREVVVRRGDHLAVEDTGAFARMVVADALKLLAHARKTKAVEYVGAIVVCCRDIKQ
jgi:hypothetical protein